MTHNEQSVKGRLPGPRSFYRDDSGDPLRENFYSLLRRSYQSAKRAGKGLEAYFAIVRTLNQFCAQPWVQSTVYPGESAVVQRFLAATGLPINDAQATITRSLAAHACARVFGETLMTLPRNEFAALCAVSGKEHLVTALASGRGVVIAHTHTMLTELFWSWLAFEGIAPGITLWQWTFSKDRSEFADPKIRAIESARELHAAIGLLRAGGLVHALADGQKGLQQVEVPVWNRLRIYRTGFATLAVSAKAAVLSAAVLVRADGRILIKIDAPFDEPPPDRDRTQQTEWLVRQYAERHGKLWAERPGNIPWFHMKLHVTFPELV